MLMVVINQKQNNPLGYSDSNGLTGM
jgi:hypothetical protein